MASKLENDCFMESPLSTMVSRKDAMRVWGFTEQDLRSLDNSAVLSVRRGQDGIFYTPIQLRSLRDHISETSRLDRDMIPEVVIRRQIPKSDLDLEHLRFFAKSGKLPGRKGPETYMYRKEDVQRCLAVEFITLEMRVPVHIQIEFPEPKYGLKLFGPLYGPSKLCYFGKDVAAILKLFDRFSTSSDAVHRTRSQDNITKHRATQDDNRVEEERSQDSRVEDRGSQDSMVENREFDSSWVEQEGSQDNRVELGGYQDNVVGQRGSESEDNIGIGLSGSY